MSLTLDALMTYVQVHAQLLERAAFLAAQRDIDWSRSDPIDVEGWDPADPRSCFQLSWCESRRHVTATEESFIFASEVLRVDDVQIEAWHQEIRQEEEARRAKQRAAAERYAQLSMANELAELRRLQARYPKQTRELVDCDDPACPEGRRSCDLCRRRAVARLKAELEPEAQGSPDAP